MKTIVFACGGTLGHINPAIAMANYLNEKYNIIFFSTTKEYKNNTYKELSFKVYYFNAFGFNRKNLISNFKILKENKRTKREIKKILINQNVDLVVSMGGSIGTLVVSEAIKLKIKTIIHEQNAIMGLGNKLVYKRVNKVLLTYPIKNIKNSLVVGNPLKFNDTIKNESEDILLVFGGSIGSKVINDFFINNYQKIKLNKRIVLIVGSKYYNENLKKIKEVESNYFKILEKTDEMEKYYKKAYIVISRSGATTLGEIMDYQKIAIVIPSPNVSNNHQYHNAYYFYKKNCLKMINEKDLNIERINELLEILDNKNQREMIKKEITKNNINNKKELFKNEIDKILGD